MFKNLKNLFSLFVVLFILTPSFVRLNHDHKHFVCGETTGSHYYTGHDDCSVCSFEFSIYLKDESPDEISENEFYGIFNNEFVIGFHSFFTGYSFVTRGPPFYS